MNKTKPTPQQRIEELVREIAEFGEIWTTPFGTVDVCGAMDKGNVSVRAKCDTKPIKSFLRQALQQAYVAGMEAVESTIREETDKMFPSEYMKQAEGVVRALNENVYQAISQLKEQINK